MSHETVARRYALAVFDLAKELGTLDAVVRDLGEFAESFAGNAELREVLHSPLVPAPAREALLAELGKQMRLAELTRNTLLLLLRKRRLPALPDIARRLRRLADEDANLVRADVASAGPLSEAYLGKLKAQLEKATGKKIAIAHRQDPALIAGVVTRIGDRVIDGSVRARLQSFRDALLRG